MHIHDDDGDDEYVPRRLKPHAYSCVDRMCGVDDCKNCHPENFRRGIFTGDTENEDEET